MRKFMLDTHVFDYIRDNKIEVDKIKDSGEYFTTNVQLSELANIPDESKKGELLKIYTDLDQKKIELRSGMWLDALHWDDDQHWIDDQQEEFKKLLDNSKNGSAMDAHIGAIAKVDDLTVVTKDTGFSGKCNRDGISVMTPDEWKTSIGL